MSRQDYPEIVIAEFERNAREVVRVTLGSFEGRPTMSIWSWYRAATGELRPGKGGIVLGVRHLAAVAEAMACALSVARETGRVSDA